MWYWNDGLNGWGMLWMGIMMAVVWLPLLLLLVWGLRQFGHPPRSGEPPAAAPPPAPDAVEIARSAYARGELDRERYLQIIQDLRETTEPARPT